MPASSAHPHPHTPSQHIPLGSRFTARSRRHQAASLSNRRHARILAGSRNNLVHILQVIQLIYPRLGFQGLEGHGGHCQKPLPSSTLSRSSPCSMPLGEPTFPGRRSTRQGVPRQLAENQLSAASSQLCKAGFKSRSLCLIRSQPLYLEGRLGHQHALRGEEALSGFAQHHPPREQAGPRRANPTWRAAV